MSSVAWLMGFLILILSVAIDPLFKAINSGGYLLKVIIFLKEFCNSDHSVLEHNGTEGNKGSTN